MARLEDVCEILDSRRIPITASDRISGPYPYYGANRIQDYVADYIFDDELILLAEDGGNFCSKDRPIAYRASGKCWVNNHAHVLKPKEGYDVDYVCYSLMYYDVSGLVNGATRQKLTQADMKKMTIPERTLGEQQHIAAILDKLSSLISLRKQQLAKLDELVKARFLEMFGDPVSNSKCLPMRNLIQIITLQRGYDLPIQCRDSKGNIPVYGSNGVLDCHSHGKSSCGVVTGRSGTIGKVHYCKGEFWPLNTTLFSIDTHGNDIIYLAHLLMYYNLERFHDGTGVPTLNRNIIHKQPIIDVPLERQEVFSSFVEQVTQKKQTIQQSLDKLETLKKSLMQEYFG